MGIRCQALWWSPESPIESQMDIIFQEHGVEGKSTTKIGLFKEGKTNWVVRWKIMSIWGSAYEFSEIFNEEIISSRGKKDMKQ